MATAVINTELTAVAVVTPEIRCVNIVQRSTPAPAVTAPNLISPGANRSKITFSIIRKQFFYSG